MTERGLSNDEIEKQLQEEEAKMNINPEQIIPESQEEANIPESMDTEQEKVLMENLGDLENKAEDLEKTIQEVGGTEGINEILGKMSPEEKIQLEKKIEEQKNLIIEKTKELNPISKNLEGNWSDRSWAAAMFMFKNTFDSVPGFLASPLLITAAAPLAVISGPKKAVDTIRRKIQLSIEKRKLTKMTKAVE